MAIASNETVTDRLSRPNAYAECPDHVDEVETHISRVFLTQRFAYKLKKPVQFDFLDFSTLERRQQACKDELRLNRRLCPDVYLGVLPITITARGKIAVDGPGTTIDWVVKMRRLPDQRRLDHLLKTDQVSSREIDQLASILNQFYLQQPPLTIRPEAYMERLREQIRSNWGDLLEKLPQELVAINRAHSALVRYLSLQPGVFVRRVCDGRIVDGHGDLRPDHVYLVSTPAIIDCLEFNEQMRQVDIADEFCFFAVECEKLGYKEVGTQLIDAYSKSTHDHPEPSLMAFYKAYRACVRAKVFAIRSAQTSNQELRIEAQRYLQLACAETSKLGPHLVIAVTGCSGTGKSTLASALAASLGGELLQTDILRRQKLGCCCSPPAYQANHYQPQLRQQVYDDLFERTKRLLDQGNMVVLDGTFLQTTHQAALIKVTRQQHALPVFIRCECPTEVAAERLRHRRGMDPHGSEAYPGLLAHQIAEQAPQDPSQMDASVFTVDTCQPVEDQVQAVSEHLRTLLNFAPIG